MRARLALILALAALAALAGCGPTPPQAPKHEAQRIDHSTGVISSACGEASQVSAFGGDAKDLDTLEANAASSALDLAAVYRRNPGWIYQSETVGKIVHDAISLLDSCGLHRAGHTLARATGR